LFGLTNAFIDRSENTFYFPETCHPSLTFEAIGRSVGGLGYMHQISAQTGFSTPCFCQSLFYVFDLFVKKTRHHNFDRVIVLIRLYP